MNEYSDYIAGFFTHHEQAESVIAKLVANGFQRRNVHLLGKYAALPNGVVKDSRDAALNDIILKDVLIYDAILEGKIVVIAEISSIAETNIAEKIMQAVMGDCYDVI